MSEVGLVGTWQLESYTLRDRDDVTTAQPWGTRPLGLLQYGPDGYMSVFHGRSDRSAPSARGWVHLDAQARAEASEGFDAYAGRYVWLGDRVLHDVEVALFPGWIGVRLERRAVLDGDTLTLRAPTIPAGESRPVLIWRRAHVRP